MTSKVCVLGSINMDVVVRVDRFPQKGETISGLACDLIPGGKGANQAVAVANMSVPVDIIGVLGDDEFGKILLRYLNSANINTEAVAIAKSSSGTAIVAVNADGENQIVVVPGSNAMLQWEAVERYLDTQGSAVRYIISQFETPIDITSRAFAKAKSFGSVTVLNPSPMCQMSDELVEHTDIFVLNELELKQAIGLTGQISSPEEAVQAALRWKDKTGDKTIVVTLGKHGLVATQGKSVIKQPARLVANVVDTTGAGDCFCGSFVAFLHKDHSLEESLSSAQKAAAYSIQRKGASPSFPKLETLNLNKAKGD